MGSARLPHLAELEVRVLDDAEQVAERIPYRRHLDAAAHVLHGLVDLGSQGRQAGQLSRGIWDPPEHLHPGEARLAIGNQPQLEAAGREADVERLVEVWVAPEHLAIPVFASGEVRCGIDGSPQPLNHGTPLSPAELVINADQPNTAHRSAYHAPASLF